LGARGRDFDILHSDCLYGNNVGRRPWVRDVVKQLMFVASSWQRKHNQGFMGTYLQLVEHLFEEQGVIGSNPIVPVENLRIFIILGIERKRLQTQSFECEMERANTK